MDPGGEGNVEVPSVCQPRSPRPWSKSDILWESFKRDTNKSHPGPCLDLAMASFYVLKPASQVLLIK